MSKRQFATTEDLQTNKWLWLDFDTAFNGEGGISCPAKLRSINGDHVSFTVFGEDFGIGGIKRGQLVQCSLEEIKKGKSGVFVPNTEEIEKCIAREIKWAQSQKEFLETYLLELQINTA